MARGRRGSRNMPSSDPITKLVRNRSDRVQQVTRRTARGGLAGQPAVGIPGTGKAAPSRTVRSVKVVKQVNPLSGQGSAKNSLINANRNTKTVSVKTQRVKQVAPPNTGSRVVRPPRTAVRINPSGRVKLV